MVLNENLESNNFFIVNKNVSTEFPLYFKQEKLIKLDQNLIKFYNYKYSKLLLIRKCFNLHLK